ncbi:MAG: Na+/H+ antiporter NhaA [Gammaproteobacteria bacterium]|nr:Na+/H+ antiporter NhaA [Gammaproteobacteria bacterium]
MVTRQLQRFIKMEALGGILLFVVLVIALIIANSGLANWYSHFIDLPLHFGIAQFVVKKPLVLWVNEGLMAIFFMLLALEIKREILEGELSEPSQLTLPIAGAIGGIVLPIAIYVFFNHHDKAAMPGWPIPTTTDIAFMLGIVALLGDRVPTRLKIMLIALSIVDDIVAVTIIAAVYTGSLSWLSLEVALLGVLVLLYLNFRGVSRVAPYILIGVVICFCVLKSGVHATLGGVIVGLTIPLSSGKDGVFSPLRHLEKHLHPWVVFLVLPLFVFFNGGVSFQGISWGALFSSVPLGIAAGLFVGKTLGVFLFCSFIILIRWAKLPEGVRFSHLLGISALTGIGFTMSLFLGALAFTNTPFENLVRQGVLLGSLCSAVFGVLVLSLRK